MTSPNESVFTWAAPPLKFGHGALDEIGAERVLDSVPAQGVEAELYGTLGVEPTDPSVNVAVAFARERGWDAYIAVPTTAGTGSESTTICVIGLLDMHLDAGISRFGDDDGHAAASGMDVLSHALESWCRTGRQRHLRAAEPLTGQTFTRGRSSR